MGRTSAHKQKSGQSKCRVQNNSCMYNPGIFVSNALHRHGCENKDTERANVKSQYCERNVSWSRHMAVRSACKIYWQGENVSTRVDVFEKNASRHTRQPSPQPVNFCSEWLFTANYMIFEGKKGKKILWERPRSKYVGDSKNTGPQRIFLKNKATGSQHDLPAPRDTPFEEPPDAKAQHDQLDSQQGRPSCAMQGRPSCASGHTPRGTSRRKGTARPGRQDVRQHINKCNFPIKCGKIQIRISKIWHMFSSCVGVWVDLSCVPDSIFTRWPRKK